MFWVYLKISAIFLVSDILPILKYTSGSQEHLWVLIITLDLRYILLFIFWLYLNIPISLQVLDINSNVKYTFKSQIQIVLHVLDIFEGICRLPSLIYILRSLNNNKKLTTLAKSPQSLRVQKVFILVNRIGDLALNNFGALGATGLSKKY